MKNCEDKKNDKSGKNVIGKKERGKCRQLKVKREEEDEMREKCGVYSNAGLC